MNARARVVIERFPTARLPPEIREQLDFGAEVRIEVRPVDSVTENLPSLGEILEAAAAWRSASDDPVARVRAIRREWAEREERNARIRAGDAE
jgi:hypothetical protein